MPDLNNLISESNKNLFKQWNQKQIIIDIQILFL